MLILLQSLLFPKLQTDIQQFEKHKTGSKWKEQGHESKKAWQGKGASVKVRNMLHMEACHIN